MLDTATGRLLPGAPSHPTRARGPVTSRWGRWRLPSRSVVEVPEPGVVEMPEPGVEMTGAEQPEQRLPRNGAAAQSTGQEAEMATSVLAVSNQHSTEGPTSRLGVCVPEGTKGATDRRWSRS